ncbi:MAG: NAD-dependent deacylase [Gammaproteobacteria bacterium]|jgi:NAD-dependent deacetylase|nr:NAD-dependent deacylase [Gammaproteobacteria bacterium]
MGAEIPAAVIEILRDAKNILVLTGSGVSAESGVPTFREAQSGLWAEFDPQELATPEAFLQDPVLAWRWYRWRRKLVAEAEPNPGHFALAALEDQVPEMTLITQNVDGLHQRAGSQHVTEFHGNLFTTRCFVEDTLEDDDPSSADPRCRRCGGHLRPGVVWFGEAIPKLALKVATEAADDCDVFLSIGTSSLVWPAAGFAAAAAQRGATVIEINIDPTPLSSRCDFALQGASGELLPELVRRLAI